MKIPKKKNSQKRIIRKTGRVIRIKHPTLAQDS